MLKKHHKKTDITKKHVNWITRSEINFILILIFSSHLLFWFIECSFFCLLPRPLGVSMHYQFEIVLCAIMLLLRLPSFHPPDFVMFCFHFHSILDVFKFPCWLFLWHNCHLVVCCFMSMSLYTSCSSYCW